MKYTTVIILLLAFTISSFSQDTDKVKITVETETVKENQINVTVKITGAEPNFSYYLFDNEPWNGGQVVKFKKNQSSDNYTFKKIKPGKYFITVRYKNDKKGISDTYDIK